MILFVNACIRSDSRTKKLADVFLSKCQEPIEEVSLENLTFPVVKEAFLQKRDQLIQQKAWDDPMFDLARQFAAASEIVIAAPFWDLSFPASLKQYIEQINVSGITFKYTEEGFPVGLCKATKLTYITTAGGYYLPFDYGFGYVQDLCKNFYGIENVQLIKAAGLDIIGADVGGILNSAIEEITDSLESGSQI